MCLHSFQCLLISISRHFGSSGEQARSHKTDTSFGETGTGQAGEHERKEQTTGSREEDYEESE